MPAVISFPEGDLIRRLAGSLSVPRLVSEGAVNGVRNMNQTVRGYFRYFPWSGKAVASAGFLPDRDIATVGQYFRAFDWEGLRRFDSPAVAGDPVPAAAAPPRSDFTGFFDSILGD